MLHAWNVWAELTHQKWIIHAELPNMFCRKRVSMMDLCPISKKNTPIEMGYRSSSIYFSHILEMWHSLSKLQLPCWKSTLMSDFQQPTTSGTPQPLHVSGQRQRALVATVATTAGSGAKQPAGVGIENGVASGSPTRAIPSEASFFQWMFQ